MISITKRSPFSGRTSSMKIDTTDAAIAAWEGGMLIQDAMPNLNADEREFIMTGITPYEWADKYGDIGFRIEEVYE